MLNPDSDSEGSHVAEFEEEYFEENDEEYFEKKEKVSKKQQIEIYQTNRNMSVGSKITCPMCKKIFEKTTYQKAFCSNQKTRKESSCKDNFWNIFSTKDININNEVKKFDNENSTSSKCSSFWSNCFLAMV